MSDTGSPGRIVEIAIGDEPESWEAAGFSLADDAADVGGVTLRFIGSDGHRGIVGWRLDGIDDDLDGLPTVAAGPTPANGEHPNAVTSLDHVVAGSPDLGRTTMTFSEQRIELRHTRDFEREGVARQQRFFWFGSVILELIGRAEPRADAEGPATFWGLAFTSEDIDRTCEVLGDATSAHRAAIQPSRRISTLRSDELGISIPVAFMSPHVKAAPANGT